jgi:hypothetical protein
MPWRAKKRLTELSVVATPSSSKIRRTTSAKVRSGSAAINA